jgi:hypothetical protein
MKVKYIVNNRGDYESQRKFTFGKEYQVIADYRKRQSGQIYRDNGFVINDNRGQENMLFYDEVVIIEDGEQCFVFDYSEKVKKEKGW